MQLINKVLSLPHTPFETGVDLKILEHAEKLVGRPLMWVDYREIQRKGMNRRFFVRAVYDLKDKKRG